MERSQGRTCVTLPCNELSVSGVNVNSPLSVLTVAAMVGYLLVKCTMIVKIVRCSTVQKILLTFKVRWDNMRMFDEVGCRYHHWITAATKVGTVALTERSEDKNRESTKKSKWFQWIWTWERVSGGNVHGQRSDKGGVLVGHPSRWVQTWTWCTQWCLGWQRQ